MPASPEQKPSPSPLDPAGLLVAEYSYIAQTAFQANEDRARVSQLYFVTFGTLIAALVTTQLNNVDLQQVYPLFAFFFLAIFVYGLLTMLQLARLRLAWMESVRAMNQIKDELVRDRLLKKSYFRWTLETIPPAFKLDSISFIMALTVALLSGVALGSAAAFYRLAHRDGRRAVAVRLCRWAVRRSLLLILVYWLPLRSHR